MQHPFHTGLRIQPFCHRQGRSFQRVQTNRQGLQSPQGQRAIIRRNCQTQLLVNRAQFRIGRVISRRYAAQQKITVPADIFRQGLHRDIDAMREGVKQHTGCVGVVQGHGHAFGMCGLNDGRHILDFHCHRAWAFTPNQRRIRANEV